VSDWSKHPSDMQKARQMETDIRFRLITDETMPTIADSDCEEPDRCQCKDPKGHTLAIKDGSIAVVHTACGKQPWFMYDDWTEHINMGPVPVKVDVATCPPSSHYYEGGVCDCGPEITLSLEGN